MGTPQKLQTNEVRKGLKLLRDRWDAMVTAPAAAIDTMMWFHEPLLPGTDMPLATYVVNFLYGGHSRRALKKEKAERARPCAVLRVGFGSQSRVGKDSAAAHLARTHGGATLSFAKPIYDLMYHVQGRLSLPQHKDPEFLQAVGQWACRRNPTVWIDQLVDELDELPPTTNVYVTDVRKRGEAAALRRRGFRLIKIVRPDREVDRDPHHVTETDLEDASLWDAVIVNDGGLEQLFQRVDAAVFGQSAAAPGDPSAVPCEPSSAAAVPCD